MTIKENPQMVLLHPSTSIDHKPVWVMYHDFVLTKKNYIRTNTEVDPNWFWEACESYFDLEEFKNSEAKQELVKLKQKK